MRDKSALARWIRAKSTRLILSGTAVIALLAWGTYAVLTVSTLPSDQASILNAVWNGENNFAANSIGNGTVMRPGSGAQYILMFQTNIPASKASGTYSLPAGGYALGPLPWTSFNSSDSSFQVRYAVFTYAFSFLPGPKGCCPVWYSGPLGNMSSSMGTSSYGGLNDFLGQPTGFGWHTSILEVDSPGNYTLHFFNSGAAGNATGRVAMGSSAVVFSRSRPYLYAGVTTEAIAVALAAITVLDLWRKPKLPGPT